MALFFTPSKSLAHQRLQGTLVFGCLSAAWYIPPKSRVRLDTSAAGLKLNFFR